MSSTTPTSNPTVTIAPSQTPSSLPSFVPSTIPTDPAPTARPLPDDSTTIEDFDLSSDQYGWWRVPLIVIGMALFHLVLILLIKHLRRKSKYGLLPPKTKPLSGKDRERHVLAKLSFAMGCDVFLFL